MARPRPGRPAGCAFSEVDLGYCQKESAGALAIQADCGAVVAVLCSGYNVTMLYMVLEKYTRGAGPVYERAAERGRMLPPGLRYIDSWVADNERVDRCFQLVETDNPGLLDDWRARWADLVDFEIYPVIKSDEAAARVGVRWSSHPPGQ